MNIKRYDVQLNGWPLRVSAEELSHGEWVKYEDVKHLIKKEQDYQQDNNARERLQARAATSARALTRRNY